LKEVWFLTLNVEIPSSIGSLTKLTSFMIQSSPKLAGFLPKSLGQLSSLTYLHITGTSVSGEIPEEIGDITALSELQLNDNKLTGSIPSSLIRPSIWAIALDNNELTGKIPLLSSTLKNCTFIGNSQLCRDESLTTCGTAIPGMIYSC
jgi:Leucine-rich repeat (LRR) protein